MWAEVINRRFVQVVKGITIMEGNHFKIPHYA